MASLRTDSSIVFIRMILSLLWTVSFGVLRYFTTVSPFNSPILVLDIKNDKAIKEQSIAKNSISNHIPSQRDNTTSRNKNPTRINEIVVCFFSQVILLCRSVAQIILRKSSTLSQKLMMLMVSGFRKPAFSVLSRRFFRGV